MAQIILLQDLLDQKKRKQEELVHYTQHLEVLLSKLEFIRREIALTEKIISMVKKEEIFEIGKK